MKPQLIRVGSGRHPVVVIDQFSGRLDPVLAAAEALAPFPAPQGNYYPGLRRVISEADGAAYDYVVHMLEDSAQFIAGAFDCEGFDLLEASFSMVTTGCRQLPPRSG